MWQQKRASLVFPEVTAVNCTELKYLICFLSHFYNQTPDENRG